MAADIIDHPSPSDVGVQADEADGPQIGIDSATISAPPIKKDGELDTEQKSVRNISQAWDICKALDFNNKERALRTATIQAIHDGEPPRSSAKQAEKAKSWQSNFSTNWLAGIVGRVAQRFVNAEAAQLYVTQARLPSSIPDYKRKSDIMQGKFTRLVRGWSGNSGLINSLAVETTLQGYTYGVFLDPTTWKPTMFKQDRCYMPELSGEHAREIQFFVAKMDYRLDEFLDLWKDEEIAGDNGYNLDNCIWAANNAKMQDPRVDATTTEFRRIVELINEGVLGLTYTNSGARVVYTYLLFNREYDGKVSFWLIERDSGKLLRFSSKLFDKMENVLAMYYFEPGNGCIHSSKGIGRKLAAVAISKELTRCSMMDNIRMSSLCIVRVDPKDRNRMAPTIMAPFVVLDKSIDVSQTQFTPNAEAYETADQFTDNWAEQATGAWITQQLDDKGKPAKTATQSQLDANRETETADIQIRRWLDLMANLRQIQQLRAFSDDNIKEARRHYEKFQKDPKSETYDAYDKMDDPELMLALIEIMREQILDDEIKAWRRSPASIFAHVQDTASNMGIGLVVQKYKGDPAVNQTELKTRDIESMVGPEVAKLLIMPGMDQDVVLEAARFQMIESSTMYDMQLPISVAPADNHAVHCATLQTLLTTVAAPVLSQGSSDPKLLKTVELNMNHFAEHLQAMVQLGQNQSAEFKEFNKFYQGFKKQFIEVIQIHAHAALAQKLATEKLAAEHRAGVIPGSTGGSAVSVPATPAPTGGQPGSGGPPGTVTPFPGPAQVIPSPVPVAGGAAA